VNIAGIKSLTVNGIAMDITSAPDFSIAKTKADELDVEAGEPGISYKPRMPFIEFEAFKPTGRKLSDFRGIKNADVILKTYNGTYFWKQSSEISDSGNNPSENKMTLRFVSWNCGEV
jgi:hypothetical protein